jgi:hypothetical protein
MKTLLILATIAALSTKTYSQIAKKVIVEHFTNTKCSVCASKNPGFYTNLNNQTGVIHLSVHPSSPYSSCVLSQHNPTENDGRTNFYSIYGSTPRLVIQGVVISGSANYNLASMFTPYLNQTTPASIKITQSKYDNDSIRSLVVIKTEATHSLGTLKLFVALAEDTVTYTGSNGEPKHFDVFRKSLTGITGINVTLPTQVGDSVVYTNSSPSNLAWNFSRIYTLAILQDATTKAVIQSESVYAKSNNINTGLSNSIFTQSQIAVNAYEKDIYIYNHSKYENLIFTIYDLTGREILKKELQNHSDHIPSIGLSAGLYIYSIKSKEVYIKTGKLFLN